MTYIMSDFLAREERMVERLLASGVQDSIYLSLASLCFPEACIESPVEYRLKECVSRLD
jgi:hypothetical protein